MLVNSLNQTKSSFSHVFAHENDEVTAIYGGLNYSNVIYYAYDTINGVPPLSFKSNGEAIEDYIIEGNTLQNGTPTPEAPVDVVGCGAWDEVNQSFKLPLAVNGTEYPVYLGEVQTTRRIKKLVLTGTEDWRERYSEQSRHLFRVDLQPNIKTGLELCSHFEYNNKVGGAGTDVGFDVTNLSYIRFRPEDAINVSLSDWKAWLAAEYAAGTPVTVWYVLAEPETAVVNEPLHKIGDYADTINYTQSGIAIPTINGTNTLAISTTVSPSNVEATGRIKRIIEGS